MTPEGLELREKLFFHTPVADFATVWRGIREEYVEEFPQATAQRRQAIIALLADLTIDMQSYLLRWHLQRPENPVQLADRVIQTESLTNYILLEQWGAGEKVASIKQDVAAIQDSNFLKLSRMADRGTMNTRWGHDYASGVTTSLRKGAILVTTNPPLVNMARKDDPDAWNPVKERLQCDYPGASPDQLTSLFTMEVVLQNCRELRPIFEATRGQYGYVNFQVNPHHWNTPDKMAAEIESIYATMTEALGGTPNVVFKVPGTKAALETVKRVTPKGIGVTITLSFAVDQHLAFAEVIEQGQAPVSFLVMMNGRLDDPVKDELQQLGVPEAAEAAKWGSTAIVRRSYQQLGARGYAKSALLVASLRGPWNIEGCLTDGARPLFITSFPDKTAEYDCVARPLVSRITEPIPADMLEKLHHSPIFRQGYEIGGLTVDGFDTFYPVVQTLTSFSAAYDEIRAYLERR